MTDPYSSPRYPTDPVEPQTSAGYGSVPPAPTAPGGDGYGGAHRDTAPEDTVFGGTRFEEEPSIDELAPGDGAVDVATTNGSGDTDGDSSDDSSGGAREKAAHVAETAKDEAASVAGTAKDEASDLASSAKGAASSVLDAEKSMAHDTTAEATERVKETLAEAKTQVRDLWQQSRSELAEGAGVQLQRLSLGAKTVSDELSTMASASDDPGIASDLARRASGYLSTASTWLEDRSPEEVLGDVSRFARRSPGTFLAIAAGLGLVAGRVARSLKDDSGSSSTSTSTSTGSTSGTSTSGARSSTATSGEGTSAWAASDGGVPPVPSPSVDGYGTTGYAGGAVPSGSTAEAGYGAGSEHGTESGYGTGTTSADGTRTAGHVPTSSQPGATTLDGGELR
ncbi:hypothetical protein SANBI_001177 [Sanguibacter sp. 4.1]|uniref:ATP synthase F0 subunit B n=1 Tax=Sanguibacter biliveldensis TaxID=3030830 RepID=A0AAF1C3S2_9MICO|nr:hypothetical protein [Sanguibacter sp. 4.1]WPF83495.1 hypothetical protein SANBI_001177 [Sanguibacter sp. 4.1]